MSSNQLGKYEIVEELGAGGFASVFRALDTTLGREVALKVLHPPLLADRRFVQNFRQEARTLAALRHPQIVTIYEVGEIDGRIFLAMELARGTSLARAIAARKRIDWPATLALLKPICDALDYAHAQRVAHRDLKPANILIDTQRGALLTDFGFARLLAENSASMTLSGGIVGTPGYIAPEVWENNSAEPSVDIYALGCIAHEMLTGDVLFKGATPIQAMRAHDRGPQFPASWPEDVPPGITDVLGKALAREPAERYGSAGALWGALSDLQAQQVAAHEAAQRAEAERQAVARRDEEAKQAAEQREQATKHEAEERTALAAQWRAETERAIDAAEWDAARMAIGRWQAAAPGDPAIGVVLERLERASQTRQRANEQRHMEPNAALESPSGVPTLSTLTKEPATRLEATRLSMLGSPTIVGAGAVAIIVLLILLSLIRNTPIPGGGSSSFSPTQAPTDATATLPPATGGVATETKPPTKIPAQPTLNTSSTAAASPVISETLAKEVAVLGEGGGDVSFSPDGLLILSRAFLWDANSGKKLNTLRGHVGSVSTAKFSPNGKLIVAGSQDDAAHVWQSSTGEEVAVLRGHVTTITKAVFSPDSQLVAATAYRDPTVWVWNALTGERITVLDNNIDDDGPLAFSPDSTLLATSTHNNTVLIWEARSGNILTVLPAARSQIEDAIFSLDGQYLITAGGDGTARVWQVSTGKQLAVMGENRQGLNTLALSPDGKYIATAGDDRTARVYELSTGKPIAVLSGHTDPVRDVAFSPNGRFIATGSVDNTVKIWQANTGTLVTSLTWEVSELNKIYGVFDVAFSPDGKYVAIAEVYDARLWELNLDAWCKGWVCALDRI